MAPLRVAIVAEYYPRPAAPSLGIWAHRQAMAVRDRGIEVSVLALERPLPPLSALRSAKLLRQWAAAAHAQPRKAQLDGIDVRYVRFVSPPRPTSYASWGRWAARPLGRALSDLRRRWSFDLVHTHYAIPAGDATLRWMSSEPTSSPSVVSVHGGDISFAAARSGAGHRRVCEVLGSVSAVAANSEYTRQGIVDLTGDLEHLEIVHLGADIPAALPAKHERPTLVTVATLEARKNQASVIRALAALAGTHPDLRYVVVGAGRDRDELGRLAGTLGVSDRVAFLGSLTHERAMDQLARCHIHVLPSADEPFGVAHIEAMAAGVPAIAGAGTGAEDIARAGGGITLVPPGDESALARSIGVWISDSAARERAGRVARQTIEADFTWDRCGEQTERLYRSVLPG